MIGEENKMSFSDSMKKLIGLEEIDDDETITEDEINAAKERLMSEKSPKETASPYGNPGPGARKKSGQAGKAPDKYFSPNTGAFRLIVTEPKSLEECPKLVDSLKGRRPVIINLEAVETDMARKIFDFMNGATYALNGTAQKVTNNIIIFAPENVDVSTSQGEHSSFDFNADDNIAWR